jgi:hypothetical protein
MAMDGTGSGDGCKGLPEPIRGASGATFLGPRNVPLERENPDLLASPETDAGTIPSLKVSLPPPATASCAGLGTRGDRARAAGSHRARASDLSPRVTDGGLDASA